MRHIVLLMVVFAVSITAFGQKYTAEKAFISFYSDAPLEDITADNNKVTTIFNAGTGDIAFSVPMKEFKFAKSLMQEHFNEKYVESEKFPKATFQGKIVDFKPDASGVQNVKAQGKLTIHGVTKDIDVPGTIEVQGKKLAMKSKFKVKVADYDITIPQIVFNNIAEEVEVTIDFVYKPM
ncbi:MAG TPA: YceI family protein [Cyclobacteriaceae bacterium]|nr:YceI family protein [Cyclobacteriaceae bacterium]